MEVKSVSREAGHRTKMAIYSSDSRVDAVGACVGNKGSRVNAVVEELGGEKIDIIPWSENPLEFIAKALSPATVISVTQTGEKSAVAVVPDEKLSLAIGRDGQNARLAARLTGWKIDVKDYSTAEKLGLLAYDEETNENTEAEQENPEATTDPTAEDNAAAETNEQPSAEEEKRKNNGKNRTETYVRGMPRDERKTGNVPRGEKRGGRNFCGFFWKGGGQRRVYLQ